MEHDYEHGYPGYGGYYNNALNSPTSPRMYHTNGLLIPRPHVHGGGGATGGSGTASFESNTDHVDAAPDPTYAHTPPLPPRSPSTSHKQAKGIHKNTFQREINRAVEPFRSTYRDYNERHRQPIGSGHI